MHVIGVDEALAKTGLVVLNQNGVIKTDVIKTDSKMLDVKRLIAIRNQVEGYASQYKPDLVAFEGIAFMGWMAPEIHGVLDILGVKLFEMNCRYVIVAPSRLKKYACGKGNAKKDMVRKDAYKKWSVEFESLDVTEAFVLAKIAEAVWQIKNEIKKIDEFLVYEQDVLKELIKEVVTNYG